MMTSPGDKYLPDGLMTEVMTEKHRNDDDLRMQKLQAPSPNKAAATATLRFQVSAGYALPVTRSAIYWLALNTATTFWINC